MNRRIITLLFMIIPVSLFSQQLVLDTLIVRFHPDSIFNGDLSDKIRSVVDEREADSPSLLNYHEKKKYFLIPVDQQILADRPVAELFTKGFNLDEQHTESDIRLGIHHLDFTSQTHYFFRSVSHLNASIIVYKDSSKIGELVYQISVPHSLMGKKKRRGYRVLVEQLVRNIASDMDGVDGASLNTLANFRTLSGRNPWMQLQTGGEIAVLTGGHFLIDGYLSFVYPETRRSWIQSVGAIRYRRMKRFDAIEWGIASDWKMRRYAPNWVLRIKSNLMLGLNRWNDMRTYRHKLYDALILDAAAGPSIHFHPKNQRSFSCGIGLLGNVYYIYSTRVRFAAGLTFQLGVQL